MNTSKRTVALRRLFDLCEDLQRLRSKIADPEIGREVRTRLRRQSKRKAETLQRDLGAYRFRGPIGAVMREFKFSPQDFQVLGLLLERHMRSEDPGLEGRLILGSLFDSSFDVLSSLEILHDSGPLRSSGMVVLDDDADTPDDVLEARFRLSDEAIETLRLEISGFTPEDQRRQVARSYANHRELLNDLRVLHNLYRARSERVFHADRWERVHDGRFLPGAGLTKRIDGMWARVRAKLEATEGAAEFPVVRFLRDFDLSEEETIIVVHLLFKELYEGVAYADAAELVRLVSSSEDELIRFRALLLPGNPLGRAEIIENEPMLENRVMTGEVHLADWAVNALFGASIDQKSIHADERLDWHLYLESLSDAGEFFRDMEAN